MEKNTQWLQAVADGEEPVNLMIDFETFGNNPETCGIMSVAIKAFSEFPNRPVPLQTEIVMAISMESNYEWELDIASSQKWWNKPERTAAWSWYVEMDKYPIEDLQKKLREVFCSVIESGREFRLWSRGDFDIRILRRLMKDMDVEIPYYVIRDARTFIRGLHIDESLYMDGPEMIHTPMGDCNHCISLIQQAHVVLAELGFFNDRRINGVTDEANHSRMRERINGGKRND